MAEGYRVGQLIIESVGLVRGDQIPEGAKSVEAVAWGALAGAVLPSFLTGMVTFLQSWMTRGEKRKAGIKSQTGDNCIKLEYSPTTLNNEKLMVLISVLSSSMQLKEEKVRGG
jgi:hypothetical protein